MKKKVIALMLVAVTVFSMAGCGKDAGDEAGGGKKAKAPSLEELKGNFSDQEVTSFDAKVKVSADADVEYDNLSSQAKQIIGMLESQLDCELDGELSGSATIDLTGKGQRNDEYSYTTVKGSVSVKTNIDEINELIDDELDGNDKIASEKFIDYDEETVYTKEDDEWYDDYYEEADEEADVNEALEALIDFCIAKNENAKKGDEVKVETAKDGYSLKLDLNLNNDYLSDIEDDELEALEDLLEACNVEVDVDDILEIYEEYGDYAEFNAPFSIEILFEEDDDEYVITGVNASLTVTAEGSWDQDVVSEIAGEDLEDEGFEFDIDFKISVKFTVNVTVGYDEEDIDVPDGI